eukprot:jgi/Galph1/3721/GphlegSOOS_G2396.1
MKRFIGIGNLLAESSFDINFVAMLRTVSSKFRISTLFTRQLCSESSTASSSQAGKAHKVPSGVAGRYASTLLSLAGKEGCVDAIVRDMKQFRTLESDHPDLKRFLKDPSVPKGEKFQLMQELLKRENFSDLFTRFVSVVQENRRIENLSSIVETLEKMIEGDKGGRVAIVVTATPFTEWQICFLRKRLIKRFYPDDPDTELEIQVKEDPSLISGFTVQVGEQFIDLSYKKEMRKVREALRQA